MSNFTLFTATESSSPALPVVWDGVLQLPCLCWRQCLGSCAAGLKINLTTRKKGVFLQLKQLPELTSPVLTERGAAMNG